MISYAENFEDVMLERVFSDVEKGFYIDVGAADPTFMSVTLHFYLRSWRGINIEPVTTYHELLKQHRSRDININMALGNTEGQGPIFDVEDSSFQATLRKDYAETYSKQSRNIVSREVEITTLEKICDKYVKGEIHFLKIDVEGSEREVIEGGNWSKYRPYVVLVEAIDPITLLPSWSNWEPLLTDNGYHFVYFDGLNRFYVKDEARRLDKHFPTPPNVFDHFTLANQSHEQDKMQIIADKQELSKIKDSKSWRYTKPLRELRRWIRSKGLAS